MPRLSSTKLNLIRDTIKKLGYVDLRSVRRWFNLTSLRDAEKALRLIARRDKSIQLVYALTFERPGALTVYRVEEAIEEELDSVKERLSKEGWILKSVHLIGAKTLE